MVPGAADIFAGRPVTPVYVGVVVVAVFTFQISHDMGAGTLVGIGEYPINTLLSSIQPASIMVSPNGPLGEDVGGPYLFNASGVEANVFEELL